MEDSALRIAFGVRVNGLVQNLGEPPIEHEDFTERADHDVGGLQVPMQDAPRVGEGHRVADAQKQPKTVGHRGHRVDVFVEPLAFDELHGVEHAAVLQGADIVHGDDSRVLEACEHLRFADQAAGQFAATLRGIENFQGDTPAEFAVLRRVDHAHAAAGHVVQERIAGAFQVWETCRVAEPVERFVG